MYDSAFINTIIIQNFYYINKSYCINKSCINKSCINKSYLNLGACVITI